MQMKLVGIAPVNFTNNVGEKIVGQNVFVLYKDENVNGLKADKLFLKEGIEIPKDVKINDMLDIKACDCLSATRCICFSYRFET